MSNLLFALIALMTTACSGDIGINDVQFGTFTGIDTNNITFRARNSLSKKQQTSFGWAFSMRNPPQTLTVGEIVEGPAGTVWQPPADAAQFQISDGGGTIAVTTTIFNPGSTFLLHNWTISNSDPVGKYKASLYVDNELIRQVEFDVAD